MQLRSSTKVRGKQKIKRKKKSLLLFPCALNFGIIASMKPRVLRRKNLEFEFPIVLLLHPVCHRTISIRCVSHALVLNSQQQQLQRTCHRFDDRKETRATAIPRMFDARLYQTLVLPPFGNKYCSLISHFHPVY